MFRFVLITPMYSTTFSRAFTHRNTWYRIEMLKAQWVNRQTVMEKVAGLKPPV